MKETSQQVIAYATALGASRAFLVHPVKVGLGPIVAGGVSVRTMTFDLSLPSLVAAELLADDLRRACGSLDRTARSAASPASS